MLDYIGNENGAGSGADTDIMRRRRGQLMVRLMPEMRKAEIEKGGNRSVLNFSSEVS